MSNCTQDIGYFRVKGSAFSKITLVTMENRLEGGQDGCRPVKRFLWLSRHEVIMTWTRVVVVGSGWI